MKEYYNILLATDYSEAVMNAERYAVQFARDTKSYLTQLHVYEEPFFPLLQESESHAKLEQFKKAELKKSKDHRNKLLKALNATKHQIHFRSVVSEGSAAQKILDEAKHIDADFIIVGTHGVTGFRDTFFGSHTWKVIQNATIPVIAVPQDALYRKVNKIVFATEFREGELSVIQFLSHLAKQLEAELTILHVMDYINFGDFQKQLTNEFLSEAKRQTNNMELKIKTIKNEDVIEGINDYCMNNQVDWLIMSPEQRFLFEKIFQPGGSVVKKMAFQTRLPLITVPDHYNPTFSKFLDIVDVNTYMSEEY